MFVLAKCTWDGGGYETEWQFESKAIFKIENMTLLKAQVLPQQNATLGFLSSKQWKIRTWHSKPTQKSITEKWKYFLGYRRPLEVKVMVWGWEKSILVLEAVVKIGDGFWAEEEREKSLICTVLSSSSKCVLSNLFTTNVWVCTQFSAWIEVFWCVFCGSQSGTLKRTFLSFLDRTACLIVVAIIYTFHRGNSILEYLSGLYFIIYCLWFFWTVVLMIFA